MPQNVGVKAENVKMEGPVKTKKSIIVLINVFSKVFIPYNCKKIKIKCCSTNTYLLKLKRQYINTML